MKARIATGIILIALSLSAYGQTDIKSYFEANLQGNKAPYTDSQRLQWNDVEARRTQVWQAWCEANQNFEEDKLPSLRPLINADTLLWPLPQELEPNAIMPYHYGTKGDKPAEGWPLYLYIHGSGPKADEWRVGYILCSRFNDAPSLYFIPQIPNEGSYYRWWQRAKLFAWERLLRQSFISGEVDARRVYLFGISEGGYGSQRLASFYADYWAGAGPMAGGEPLINAPVENLAHVPLSFLTGDRDFMFYRHLLTKTTGEKLDSMQHIYPNEYKHRVELIPGMGHSIDYTPTTPWLAQHKRNAQPRHFIWENLEMDGLKRNAFYNLQVLEETDAFRTQYEFTANGDNSIDIKVDAIKYNTTWKDPRWGIDMLFSKDLTPAQHGRLRIYLSDTLADLGKKVTIRINGKEVFHGKVKSSKKTQKQARELWNDPMRDFKHAVEVNW